MIFKDDYDLLMAEDGPTAIELVQKHRAEEDLAVAAASILAKVTRDRLMIQSDAQYPVYQFARHKGYGTQIHQAALQSVGPCEIHRTSYRPIAALLTDRLI